MKYLFSLLALFISMNGALLNSAFSADLTFEQVRSIIMSGTNLSVAEADVIAKQVEETYGRSEKGVLKVSGVLTGARWNYNFFMDRKIWHLDASFIPDGQDEPIYVPGLIEAEFFNEGLKLTLIARDWVFIFLPSGMTIENLDGFDTGRGFTLTLIPGIAAVGAATTAATAVVTAAITGSFETAFHAGAVTGAVTNIAGGIFSPTGGMIETNYGPMYLLKTSLGIKFIPDLFTFPRLKMKINPDIYHNMQAIR